MLSINYVSENCSINRRESPRRGMIERKTRSSLIDSVQIADKANVATDA